MQCMYVLKRSGYSKSRTTFPADSLDPKAACAALTCSIGNVRSMTGCSPSSPSLNRGSASRIKLSTRAVLYSGERLRSVENRMMALLRKNGVKLHFSMTLPPISANSGRWVRRIRGGGPGLHNAHSQALQLGSGSGGAGGFPYFVAGATLEFGLH